MSKNLSKIAMATSLALLTTVGMAAGNAASDHAGAYVGLGLGYGSIDAGSSRDISEPPVIVTAKAKNGGLAWRVNGGYLWAMGTSFAVGADLAYTAYPDSKVSAVGTDLFKITAGSFDIAAVGKYFIDNTQWNISGKLGASLINQKISANIGGSNSKMQIYPLLGLGVGYAIPVEGMGVITPTVDFQYTMGQKASLYDDSTGSDAGLRSSAMAVLAGFTWTIPNTAM